VDLDAADFSVRRIDTGSDGYPSASWVAAGLLGAASVKDPASRLQTRWLNYYCIPRDLPAVNFDHAVSAGLLPGYFKGKIVVVGLRPEVGQAESARDQFGNPYYRFGFSPSPGAAVHAFSLLNLVHGDWLNALAFRLELLIAVAWGCAITLLFMRLSPWRAIGAALICSAGLAFASSYCQFRYRFWFPWAVPALVQTFFALVWAVGYRYTVESARRRKLRRAFAAYASPYMADQIANSDFDPAPGGKVVEATVMFTDLEGFTNMSEQLLPSELSRILISYFSLTTRAIFEQDGIVIKYIGDAVMAAWGAPVPDPNHAQRAVIAAWGMYQAGLREIEGRKFRTRFGINTGTVLAGNLGSDVRFDFTLIGDATNVGQRLEGLNKYLRTDILISESTRARAGDRIQTRNLGPFIVAGRTSPIEVHEVLGVDGTIVPPEWIAIFSQARQRFVAGDFARAADLFREVIRFRGGQDGPSQFFLEKIAERAALGSSSAAWDGVIRVETK
jgi:adenylate cyclase